MNFKKVIYLCIIIVIVSFIGFNTLKLNNTGLSKNNENVELLIGAAASLTDVLNDLKDTYEDINPNVNLNFTYGSSGALQAQIEEGAPIDIFFSAAEKQMNALEEKGLISEHTRKNLLTNKVVLVAPANSSLEIHDFYDLTKDNITSIAIGDPSHVPIGQYSEEILSNLELLDDIKEKVIYSKDVRTALTWVENEEVDCAIVYATDAYTTNLVKIIAEAPEESYREVNYPIATIKNSKHSDASQLFIEFLSSKQAAEKFRDYGFNVN
ncbi:MAG: molybdate ABC transporter substrate-binding protein [Tissierella sp.]|uniref:molybdate ABC transporter substrate-binding protein n=1 Tax=Tissierella sp. TaxID=41274 RepID=UPI003F9E2B7B